MPIRRALSRRSTGSRLVTIEMKNEIVDAEDDLHCDQGGERRPDQGIGGEHSQIGQGKRGHVTSLLLRLR